MDLKKLRRLAKRATPGPWINDCGNGSVESATLSHHRIEVCHRVDFMERIAWCEERGLVPKDQPHVDDDMDYIAAANPQMILSLLDKIEDLEKLVDQWDDPESGFCVISKKGSTHAAEDLVKGLNKYRAALEKIAKCEFTADADLIAREALGE